MDDHIGFIVFKRDTKHEYNKIKNKQILLTRINCMWLAAYIIRIIMIYETINIENQHYYNR